MAEVVPKTRPLSEDPGELQTSVNKKPRLSDGSEEQPIASTSTAATATTAAGQTQANAEQRLKGKRIKRKKKYPPPEPCSAEDVLWRDVRDLIGKDVADGIIAEGREWESPFERGEEVEVEVSVVSSTGTPPSRTHSPS